jgi:hypothetical protein
MAPTKLDPAKVLAEFFDALTKPDAPAPSTLADQIAREHGVSRQAVLHHLRNDPRWTPSIRDDVETDSAGVWRMRPIGETPLAEQIAELGRLRREGLEQAERANKALLPLLVRARQAKPGSGDDLSLGQLEVLTGISRPYLWDLCSRAEQATPKRKRHRAGA